MGHKIRTTILPGTVLDVDDAEFTDLERAGIILDDKQSAKLDAAEAKAAAADQTKGE